MSKSGNGCLHRCWKQKEDRFRATETDWRSGGNESERLFELIFARRFRTWFFETRNEKQLEIKSTAVD